MQGHISYRGLESRSHSGSWNTLIVLITEAAETRASHSFHVFKETAVEVVYYITDQPSDLNVYGLSPATCPPALPATENGVLIGCRGVGKIILVIDTAAPPHSRVKTWAVEERTLILSSLEPGPLIMRNQGKCHCAGPMDVFLWLNKARIVCIANIVWGH